MYIKGIPDPYCEVKLGLDLERSEALHNTLNPKVHCNTLQHTATHCNTLQQHTATTLCNTLDLARSGALHNSLNKGHTATHCNTLQQHTATTHCNTLDLERSGALPTTQYAQSYVIMQHTDTHTHSLSLSLCLSIYAQFEGRMPGKSECY